MVVKKLIVSNFRNLLEQEIALSSGTNIIIGDNGQGKSNILEAVTFLLSGKSFRHFEREHLIRHGFGNAAIGAVVHKNNLDYKIKLNVSAERYSVEINGKKASLNSLKKLFAVVVFSPDSLSVIKESAIERRNLIDEFLESTNPRFIDLNTDYKRVLKQRNKVLKDIAQENSQKSNLGVLESLNDLFLPLATEVTVQRIGYLREILPHAQITLSEIHKKSIELGVEYFISEQNVFEKDRNFISELMKKRLIELRDAEVKIGSSLIGPHRHDMRFLYSGNDSRFFCSQGQQRTIILALKIAQIVYHKQISGDYPILVLDDVLSELDEMRSGTLINFVQGLGTQIFISSTDVNLSASFSRDDEPVEMLVAKVDNGAIKFLSQNLERVT